MHLWMHALCLYCVLLSPSNTNNFTARLSLADAGLRERLQLAQDRPGLRRCGREARASQPDRQFKARQMSQSHHVCNVHKYPGPGRHMFVITPPEGG